MYGRQGNSSNSQPPPWLVRAEVTIHHGAPVTSESGQVPVSMSSTVTDSNGVRMIYRWNTNQSSPSTVPATATIPSPSSSSSFGFQRGNIIFTSTPPPRPTPRSFTIPRSSGLSENDSSSRGRGANVSDSGYNSEQFSSQSYSSLPSRRPSQQYNRRCRSTCSIVLSAVNTEDSVSRKESSESIRHSYDNSWRHRTSSHQHVFTRHQFSTVPEVCEECSDGNNASSAYSTHYCSRLKDKISSETTTISKDASSQTTDIESQESTSTIVSKSTTRRKTIGGLQSSDEQKTKQVSSFVKEEFIGWIVSHICFFFSKRVDRQPQLPRPPPVYFLQPNRRSPIPPPRTTARNVNRERFTSTSIAPDRTTTKIPIHPARTTAKRR